MNRELKLDENEFAYCIAHKNRSGLSCYAFHSRDVLNGTLSTANEVLARVKYTHPEQDWKIYKVVEL